MSRLKQVKIAAAALAVVLLVIMILQNRQTVETHFLFMTVSMPRALLLFITLLIGFALGVVVTGFWLSGKRKTNGAKSTTPTGA